MPRLALSFITAMLMVGAYLLGAVSPPSPTLAHGRGERCFQETGRCIRGAFLMYWESHGGLRQQGLPISDEFRERQAPPPAGDGQEYTVQYFERARFEHHPEFAGTENEVLLGLLGSEQYQTKYRVEEPVKREGAHRQNTPAFALAGGDYTVTWQASDPDDGIACYLGANLTALSGPRYSELLVNQTIQPGAPTSGQTNAYRVPPGQYYLDISGGCRWSFTLARR